MQVRAFERYIPLTIYFFQRTCIITKLFRAVKSSHTKAKLHRTWHYAVGWSVVCDCGISWSYSLGFSNNMLKYHYLTK